MGGWQLFVWLVIGLVVCSILVLVLPIYANSLRTLFSRRKAPLSLPQGGLHTADWRDALAQKAHHLKCLAAPSEHTPVVRLLSMYFLVCVFPDAEETKLALGHALEDPDPFVSYYATHHATKGKLLAWRRLALSSTAPAALRLLALHALLEELTPTETSSILLQSCIGEQSPSAEDTDALTRVLGSFVLQWHYPLKDEILERERITRLQKKARSQVPWLADNFPPPVDAERDSDLFFRELWSTLHRDDGLLRRIEATYREKRAPVSGSDMRRAPLLAQPLQELLAFANDNQTLSTLQALARIAHPVAEPTLLSCLESERSLIANEAILALGACGTSAAVKPLMRLQKKASPLQRSSIQRAISQIQTRTGAASVGGLSLATEHHEGGEISIANHEDGALSLEPHDRSSRDS